MSGDYLIGVNYWSRSGALFMWEDEYWNPEIVESEVAMMKSLGMNCCRSFIFSHALMPEPYTVDDSRLKRFDCFLKICEKHSFLTIPTFIVGHMSGQNWDFPFREGRDLYTDEFMLDQQCHLISSVVKKCRDSSIVWGYLLSNEMPLYGGEGDTDDVAAWAKRLIETVREHDPARPVGTGDGCWNAFGGNNGFELGCMSRIVDFFGPHMYVSETDTYRHAMVTELLIRFCKRYKLPVIMEEFGASSSHASDEAIAKYYEEVFFNTFMSGGKGTLGWCLSDFSYTDIEPYVHHPFELRFGVLDSSGIGKPAAIVFGRFQDFLKSHGHFQPARAEAAIVVPLAYNERFPFSSEDFDEQCRAFLQCLVLASKAGFDVEFVDEDQPESWTEYKMLLLPCTRKLLAITWDNLLDYASDGGTVYWTYYAGSSSAQQGTWMHNVEEFTGCEFTRRYGLPDLLPEKLKLSVDKDSWNIRCSQDMTVWERSLLKLVPQDNVEADQIGSDVWYVKRTLGAGKIVFVNFPLECLLASQVEINSQDQSHLLYRKLAADGNLRFSHTDNPVIRVRPLRYENNEIVLLQNVSWCRQDFARIDLEGREPLRIGGSLRPKETRVNRIESGGDIRIAQIL